MTGRARGPAEGALMSKRGVGILLGRLVGIGSLAALIAVDVASSAAAIAPAPQTLTADSRALEAGNPSGHADVPPAGHAANTSKPNHVIGAGKPAGCTSAAVVKAVA